MDVDTVCLALDDCVVDDFYFVLGLRLDHDTARLEALEKTFLDMHISVDGNESCSV